MLVLSKRAEFFAAFDGLVPGAFAEGIEDFGGGLHADVAGDERGFKLFQIALVHRAGHGDDVFDFGVEGLAGARDRLLHAVEEAGLLFVFLLLLWFFGFFQAAKQADEIGHGLSFSLEERRACASPGRAAPARSVAGTVWKIIRVLCDQRVLNRGRMIRKNRRSGLRSMRRCVFPYAGAANNHGGCMSGVRVLVGTRKGAFILTSDGKRDKWDVSGPHFGGWEIYHLKGSPVDPNRHLCVADERLVRAGHAAVDDGGKTWETVGNKFVYDGVPGTHQWYDGTPHPWEFKRVWHLEPSLTEAETVYAGIEDAALFSSTDGGSELEEMSGLREHGYGSALAPGRGRDVPAYDRARSEESGADVHRDLGGGGVSAATTRARRGSRSTRGWCRIHAGSGRGGGSLRASDRACIRRSRRRCSCRSTGT